MLREVDAAARWWWRRRKEEGGREEGDVMVMGGWVVCVRESDFGDPKGWEFFG